MHDIQKADILIVDDSQTNVLLLERLLERDGFTNVRSTTDSSAVLAHFESDPPDLLVLDLQMPAPDGFEVMELVRRWTTGDTYVPVLVLTADASRETKLLALGAGARDFLPKPFEAAEVSLRIGNLLRTRQLQLELQSANASLEDRVRERTQELEETRTDAFRRLAMAAEYRDDDTRDHTRRVGLSAAMLAAELGLDPAMVELVERVAPLHDLGKIGIPDAVLLKPGRLTPDELAIMRTHTTIGANVLSGGRSPLLAVAAEIALTHHERWDGSGYPSGLAAEHIPIAGRIVALADAFDAMTHTRPYKEAMPVPDAVAEVVRSAGSHFDPAVVEAFSRLDAERLTSPPLPRSHISLTDRAWRTLHEFTGIEGDHAAIQTDEALARALEDNPAAALIADDRRSYLAANTAACEMLRVERDQLLGRRIDDFAKPELRPHLDEIWDEFLSAGVQTGDFELVLADGETLPVVYRGVAHLLPGRHLSLLEPVDGRAPRGPDALKEKER